MSKRAWNLLEWCVKTVIVCVAAAGFGLLTAQHPSSDDIWRALIPAVMGFLVNRPNGETK